jgi:flavin-dependent dehydrogenase
MYQVKRGPMPHTIDQGFYQQAVQAGVKLHLGMQVPWTECDIVASGPAVVGGVGLGYTFQTNLSDGIYCILDNDLAPRGYGWLCVSAGDATAAIGITNRYTELRPCLDNFLAALQAHLRFEVHNPTRFGVYVNVAPPIYAGSNSGRVHVGEAGGFQDALLGFGMRYAIRSGYLAAQSITSNVDYESLWKKEFLPYLAAGTVNRMAAEALGSNFGYQILLFWLRTHRRDFAHFLGKHYRMTWLRRAAYALYRMSPDLVGSCIFGKTRYQRQFLRLEPHGKQVEIA